jgi:two-component system C4-dicarboxylate transport sensor histidine kinase DctB
MQGRGTLRIACGRHGPESVWVRFADSGPGIPEEVRARIFEPSFTTKTASGSFGLGLGLTIANEIVQKHGGSIQVADAPGGGAVFTVTLPLSPKPWSGNSQ